MTLLWGIRLALVLTLFSFCAAQVYDCPLGWDEYDKKCYHFVFYPTRTYDQAIAACQNDGANLLRINNADEHNFVTQWLEKYDVSRKNEWFTSGSGPGSSIRWLGSGANNLHGQTWWLDPAESNKTNQIVVYKYSVQTGRYGWSRAPRMTSLCHICEINQNEAYRINKAIRDFTYGQNFTDINMIPRGPKFLQQSTDIVVAGTVESAFIDCVASGNPQPRFRWFKEEENNTVSEVTSQRDGRYTLTNGKLTIEGPDDATDSGRYYCTAENTIGKIIGDPVLISFGYVRPFSNDPPGDAYAKLYQGVTLYCQAPSFNPAITVQWFKNDASHFVRPELNPHQFISHNGNLYLSEAEQSDEGSYHCVVTLAVPGKEKLVTDNPPSRTSLGMNLVVGGDSATDFGPLIHNDFPAIFPSPTLTGNDIRVECLAYGKLPLFYSWSRTDGNVNIGLPHNCRQEDRNRVLIIQNARLEDGGTYTCRVERGSTASAHKSIYVNLESRPQFVFPLKNQYIDIGSQSTLRCQVSAVPAAVYAWYKNGILLKNDPNDVEIDNNALTIINADPQRHNGMYQCSATNTHGTAYSSAEVRVLAFVPTFSKQPVTSKVATVGGNVTLFCQPEAAPAPVIKWFHNGNELSLSVGESGRLQLLRNGNLVISSLGTGDAGVYRCTATNSIGTGTSEGTLTISEHTVISTKPENTRVVVNNTAFIYCEASYDSTRYDLVYEWRFNDHRIDVSHDPNFVRGIRDNARGLYIRNVQFIHQGEYTCVATTVQDEAKASAVLTVQGPPGEPSGVYADQVGMELTLHWSDGDDRGTTLLYYIIEYNTNFNDTWRVLTDRVNIHDTIDPDNLKRRKTKLLSLRPGTGYRFLIRAANVFGYGDASLPSSMYQLPSAAPVVATQNVGGGGGKIGTLRITWKPLNLEDESGPRIGYIIYWRKKTAFQTRWVKANVTGRQDELIILVGRENYYLEYETKVGVFNQFGAGPNSTVVVIYSAESLPFATPTNIQISTYNATGMVVEFDDVDNSRISMKGKILGYQVNYWLNGVDNPLIGHSYHYGASNSLLVIGLEPNMDYWANVQVFNSAGLGPESNENFGSTAGEGPNAYPEYVEVHSNGPASVSVTWRGISTVPIIEEALIGYKLKYWPANSDLYRSSEVDIDNKKTSGVINGIEKGTVYKLRVTGYNAGGYGTKAPPVYFTLAGQVRYDMTTTEILATGSRISTSLMCVISCLVIILIS